MDIAQMAARSLAWRQPMPVTRGKMEILDIPRTSGNAVEDPRPVEYSIHVDRTLNQHQTLQPLLSLCNRTRAAALGKEVFALEVYGGETALWDDAEPRVFHPFQLIHHGPKLPVFEGATRDLVLLNVGHQLDAALLLFSLSHVFGTNLRRIHFVPGDSFPIIPHPIASPETYRVYLFHSWLGPGGYPLEPITGKRFASLANDLEDLDNLQTSQGEFEDQDAKVFEVSTTSFMPRETGIADRSEFYGEVFRQYRGGKTTINKGVREGLKMNLGFPNHAALTCMAQLVHVAERYFPELEYISMCGLIDDGSESELD
jgi:hypothetical protein